MTLDEFEQGYAERSGKTVEQLHATGRRAFPCRCGDESCEGWQMISEEILKEYLVATITSEDDPIDWMIF